VSGSVQGAPSVIANEYAPDVAERDHDRALTAGPGRGEPVRAEMAAKVGHHDDREQQQRQRGREVEHAAFHGL
jgi:hypothetical protein